MRPLLALFVVSLLACGENQTHPDRATYDAGTVAPLSCLPNLDGRIESSELQAALGVPVSYLVSPAGTTRPVDLTGQTDAQGHLVWNLATDYADDQVLRVQADALSGRWFSASFPNGQFVTPLDSGGRVQSVYARLGDDLFVLGFASTEENPPEGKTLLVYQQPVALYRFPLEVGKAWVSVGQVSNGTARGLPYAGRDTYQLKVDAAGQLQLPDLTFTQALRVRTVLTVEPSVGATVSRRQTGWLFECFGEVTRATSLDNEPKEDFTTAAELRRLGL